MFAQHALQVPSHDEQQEAEGNHILESPNHSECRLEDIRYARIVLVIPNPSITQLLMYFHSMTLRTGRSRARGESGIRSS